MYLGRIVERNETGSLFRSPRHPYTKALLASVLTPEPGLGLPDTGLSDAMPDAANIPPGCRFHPRCPVAIAVCGQTAPTAVLVGQGPVGQGPVGQGAVECHLVTAPSPHHAPL